MSILAKIKQGGESLPPRILLAGPEGIGKTTFAAQAPDPLFIAQENGLAGLDHVQRFEPGNFGEVLTLLDELHAAPKIDFGTLVIDTVDWLERSIHEYICKRDNKANVEDYGYGKGYAVAEQELTILLSKLDDVRKKHLVGVILLSHVQIKAFTSPDGQTWDRYEMKGNKRFTGILREWPDACLFAVHEVFKKKEGGKEKTIGGQRVLHTAWSPGWDAKNRLNLPEQLPFEEETAWAEFEKAVTENSYPVLRSTFEALLQTAEMPQPDREKWAATLNKVVPIPRLKNGIAKLHTMQKAA